MAEAKFSKKAMLENSGDSEDNDSHDAYIRQNDDPIDVNEWAKFFSFYRSHVDLFCTQVLQMKLYPFQMLMLRAMSKSQYSLIIACRGLGKSYITAVFFIAVAILYPNIKLGIASGNGAQARMVILQKIKGELIKNPNVAREITLPILTSSDNCVVYFKNGSSIRAITLAQNTGSEGIRGWRFNFLLIDEARLVRDSITEEILIPMTKTKRQIAIEYNKVEKGKVIFISSAYLKTSDLYKRFKFHYDEMTKGNKNYFTCTLPYQIGVQAGIFEEEDILQELDKPTMTQAKFDYEYNGVFVGSSGDSFYPYSVTSPCRTLEKSEMQQPKKSKSQYIVVHDVAISSAKTSDNASTHVIKLVPKVNGTYLKEVVYTKVHNGMSLPKQMEFLRELVHIRFPNTVKLVIDTRGNGQPLPSLFYISWLWTDPVTKEVTEFPPLVLDNDDEGKRIKGARAIIRGITATVISNNEMYTYLKSSFEDETIRLLIPSEEVDQAYKNNEMGVDEFMNYVQADLLIQELSNIKQDVSNSQNTIYERIVKTTKRDRVTSLAYGINLVSEMERGNRVKRKRNDVDYKAFLGGNFRKPITRKY